MAITTNCIFKSAIYWQQKDTQNLGFLNDTGEIGITLPLSTGSGNSQVNQVFYESGTLPSGQSVEYDLTDLTRTILNSDVPITFAKVKGISVKNKGTSSGHIISISVTGSNAFEDLLEDGTSLRVYPGAAQTFFRPIDGWTITSSGCIFQINDLYSYGVPYEISVVGVE
jgi:hypothetical protein